MPRAKDSAAPAARPAAPRAATRCVGTCARARAERPRRGEQVGVDRLERRDRLTDVEGAGHEDDGNHDRSLREANREAECVDGLAEETLPTEGRQQADPGDGRRQHERQLDERDHERAAAKASRREQVRGRRADDQDDRLGDRASSWR